MITKTVTMRVRAGGLTNDATPMLAYSKIVTRPDGNRKLFSQMVQVTDPNLLTQLRQDVKNGDEIEVTIEQTLGDTVSSVLRGFTFVEAKLPAFAASS